MLKRSFDLGIVALTVPVWLPLMALIGVLVRVCLGRPVLFRQLRPGLNGKIFELVKFRTMRDECGADGRPLPDTDRLTGFGRWLRGTSLDELPEIWNVVRGEMSLVGPRPLLIEYLDRYSARQSRRHEVRPGITGLAQVNGRNSLSWDDKFEWDVRYVETRSFWLDLLILARTLKAVTIREGINASGEATMSKFNPTVERGDP